MSLTSSLQKIPAKLVLQNGESFDGFMDTQQSGTYHGEAVFTTGMTGYTESLTDPSYAGEILCFTYPLIGNYGVPDQKFWESKKIHAAGIIISTLSTHFEHHQARCSFFDWVKKQNVPLIFGVDTRAVTKSIRQAGQIPSCITTDFNKSCTFLDFEKQNYVEKVTIKTPIIKKGTNEKIIIAIDCGMKENIWRLLCTSPYTIKRVPYNYDFTKDPYDAVFISNGPGNPELLEETIHYVNQAIKRQKPIFGICLGTQIMALSQGAKTYKLPFGHRGHNHPCQEISTKKCFITSKNHGYAVDDKTLPDDWEVTFRNLNDNTVAGIKHTSKPFFAVQFHPEACPGPKDTLFLFDKFFELI